MSDLPDSRLARDLSVSAMRLNRRLRLRHSSDRWPVAQLSILTTLLREGPMTTGELAARERIKPPSVSRSSHALVELGLMSREPHPTDGRQVVLLLTDAGTATARQEVAAREIALAEQLDELTPQQRQTLAAAARILTEIVERVD
ncbi:MULTISPECIES: MarR family winged helix-turn-helix transcriptional regulator [unclassified Rhodococcus (in: high G+C Gram-positive bacteria)]|uniref:MarR family winged helix-turn-helix transcriptional regulator n=1 Tax=unclassified Rhodococcus (in: high G+C Gram-positive bacteria) TaxID=192944 RepID=UPI000B9A4258|nr:MULTISPECIES: MarR family transcriptional regulator [unclassified Rhodococcus (in: high G+C Gram-positive bacteria)]OZE34002.1 MarR family transcriptional regulator [Rhodococcus sp. 05-2254-4]OZE51200.1 MarR family transcriptional regulator [Rhodococcus sp. 05-2254-3]OZE52851.1 MarR family transcriptional regulator [Rhodococcus sp. 05-2254-2]